MNAHDPRIARTGGARRRRLTLPHPTGRSAIAATLALPGLALLLAGVAIVAPALALILAGAILLAAAVGYVRGS